MFNKVGIIGLGKMGMAMAERFIETGLSVIGTDLFAGIRDAAKANGVEVVETAEAVYAGSQIVILSLPTAKDVEAAVASLIGKKRDHDLYIIDTTSSDPRVTQRLEAELEPNGVHFIDAPVSGGFFGARAGTLGIMVGGQDQHVGSVMEVLGRIGGKIVHMGAPGTGHSTKLLNNILGAANLATTAEIIALGENLGLDAGKLISILSAGGSRNSSTDINYPRWILTNTFDSGFTMKLMRKDVALANELVDARGELPLLSKVASIWAESGTTVEDQADFNRIIDVHPVKASAN